MEVLFWLLPAAVVTTVAMLVVGWWGREDRGQVDRETAARRLGEALARERARQPGYAAPRRAVERSSGIAIRPSRARPVVVEPTVASPVEHQADQSADHDDVESVTVVEQPAPEQRESPSEDRRAS